MKKSLTNRPSFLVFVIILFIISLFILDKRSVALKESAGNIHPTTLVAHAGGAIYGFRHTNALEALEESYSNGFQLIEIDFEWTSDGKVVAIHDWEPMVRRLFMTEPKVLSLKEFKELKVFQDLTLIDLDDLVNWLKTKDDVYIVTDMKTDNLKFLRLISESYKDIQNQIIPQVYSFEEYAPARDMGYENVILTLYKTDYEDERIVKFAEENSVFAITMPIDRGYSNLPRMLKDIDVFTYVHTVNELYIFEELYENGVSGIYTDYFHANRFPVLDPGK